MLNIRKAIADDIPLILDFIRELADYERLAHEAVATPEDLLRDGFSGEPRFHVEIAEWEGEPAGFALWFYNVSTFEGRHGIYLEDLFVRPEARGRGAGLALLRRLAARCRDEGLARLEWAVLDWNSLAINFYDALGAAAKSEWITRRLSGEALVALAGP